MSAFYVAHLLQNRRFLVTGATGGAGSMTAIALSRVGGIVNVMGRDAQKVEKLRRELHGQGHTSWVLNGAAPDFTDCGPYDGIFHAAGVEYIGTLQGQTTETVEKVMAPSVSMAISFLGAVASRKDPMLKDGGSIVLMSSVAAVRGANGMSLYCASKGAIESLTRAAAVELATRRIRVNCIRAGAFASPMHSRITQRSTPDAIDEYARRHLLGFGRAEDISNMALFLLSDLGKWCTGAAFSVDGGYDAK